MHSPAETDRRSFLKASALTLLPLAHAQASQAPKSDKPVRVLVWDERQPAQKEAYPNFLGNQIADHLRKQDGFSVESVGLDDPEQGLSAKNLEGADVLIWWGHVRHPEVTAETGKRIVARIKEGSLSLIALHSAHWSTPFVEAMNERAREDAAKKYPGARIKEVPIKIRSFLPKVTDRPTPWTYERKFPDGSVTVDLHLPLCVFPGVRNDGKPSTVTIKSTGHPIVAGVPAKFTIPKTEMYDEPYHVPEPDEVIFEECWEPGEWFRSGMLWKVGRGQVFYFRPGHETYPIFTEPHPLRIVTNAARWMGTKGA